MGGKSKTTLGIRVSLIHFTKEIILDAISAETVAQLSWSQASAAYFCCQPWPDTFAFEREAVVGFLLLRTVEEPLWWLIFKGSDSGFSKINKKIPSAPNQGWFKDLLTLGRALKRPLCFYQNGFFKLYMLIIVAFSIVFFIFRHFRCLDFSPISVSFLPFGDFVAGQTVAVLRCSRWLYHIANPWKARIVRSRSPAASGLCRDEISTEELSYYSHQQCCLGIYGHPQLAGRISVCCSLKAVALHLPFSPLPPHSKKLCWENYTIFLR